MVQVNIYEAKTRLSELVEQARRGETIVIARAGVPAARLVPLESGPKRRIHYGAMKGELKIAADFDAPLDDQTLRLFEGTSGR